MADFDREAARAKREEGLACHPIRGMGQPYPVYCGSCTTPGNVVWYPCPEIGKITMADADALDVALSVSEQQTAALRQDNQRLREKALRTLRWMEATTAGPNPRPVGKFEVAPYITALRAALSVQPKEAE